MTESEKSSRSSATRNACCGPGYASPAHAIAAAPEQLLYTVAIYTGTGVEKPDYPVTIDADPQSPTDSQVIHRLEMPNVGDELHHFGWNACSSCHHDHSKKRKYLIVPGMRSTRIHIIDTSDPRNPTLFKVIEGDEIKAKTNLGSPHTVRDRRALGEGHHRHELQLRLLVPAAPRRDGQLRLGGTQHLHAGLRSRRGRGRQVRPHPFWDFANKSVRCVLVDLTGVDTVDTLTAEHFVRMARAVKLLGARCTITGLRPEVAQTLTGMSVVSKGCRRCGVCGMASRIACAFWATR